MLCHAEVVRQSDSQHLELFTTRNPWNSWRWVYWQILPSTFSTLFGELEETTRTSSYYVDEDYQEEEEEEGEGEGGGGGGGGARHPGRIP